MHRVISLFVVTAFCTLVSTVALAAGNWSGYKPDINGDGSVNITDVLCQIHATLWYGAGATGGFPPCVDLSDPVIDMDCNTAVSVSDILLVIQAALGTPLSPELDADQDGMLDACQKDNCLVGVEQFDNQFDLVIKHNGLITGLGNGKVLMWECQDGDLSPYFPPPAVNVPTVSTSSCAMSVGETHVILSPSEGVRDLSNNKVIITCPWNAQCALESDCSIISGPCVESSCQFVQEAQTVACVSSPFPDGKGCGSFLTAGTCLNGVCEPLCDADIDCFGLLGGQCQDDVYTSSSPVCVDNACVQYYAHTFCFDGCNSPFGPCTNNLTSVCVPSISCAASQECVIENGNKVCTHTTDGLCSAGGCLKTKTIHVCDGDCVLDEVSAEPMMTFWCDPSVVNTIEACVVKVEVPTISEVHIAHTVKVAKSLICGTDLPVSGRLLKPGQPVQPATVNMLLPGDAVPFQADSVFPAELFEPCL